MPEGVQVLVRLQLARRHQSIMVGAFALLIVRDDPGRGLSSPSNTHSAPAPRFLSVRYRDGTAIRVPADVAHNWATVLDADLGDRASRTVVLSKTAGPMQR